MVKVIVLDVMSNDWGEIYSSSCEVAFFMCPSQKFSRKMAMVKTFFVLVGKMYTANPMLMCFLCSTILGFLEIEETVAFDHISLSLIDATD